MKVDLIHRFEGCLVGLAVGDALGTTLEFQKLGSFSPITDIEGGGPFKLRPGEWTDDTSMMLCLAESLLECQGMNRRDQMERYVQWMNDGHMSSNGRCFDIGNTTSAALHRYEQVRDDEMASDAWFGSLSEGTAGNGSLMRLAPVCLFHFGADPATLSQAAADSSRTTHQHPEAVDACRLYALIIDGALRGMDKEELLSGSYLKASLGGTVLSDRVQQIVDESYAKWPADSCEVPCSGYVIDSLNAALWAFTTSASFEEGLLKVVNLGGDADTNGAIYGQLAGAYYGLEGIPDRWRQKVVLYPLISTVSHELYERSRKREPTARYTHLYRVSLCMEQADVRLRRRIKPGPTQFPDEASLREAIHQERDAILAFLEHDQIPAQDDIMKLLNDFMSRWEADVVTLLKSLQARQIARGFLASIKKP